MNPGAPPPMMPPPSPMAAPPPPPSKGPWKWILIGCGALAGLGILACGGCSLLVYLGVKKAINEAVAKVTPLIQGNEAVQAEVGKVQSVSPRWDSFKADKSMGRDTIQCSLDVVGDKGKGVVLVRMVQGADRETAIVTLTFQDEQGRTTPIGTWKGGKGDHWIRVDDGDGEEWPDELPEDGEND